jgi:hypothetical protein
LVEVDAGTASSRLIVTILDVEVTILSVDRDKPSGARRERRRRPNAKNPAKAGAGRGFEVSGAT